MKSIPNHVFFKLRTTQYPVFNLFIFLIYKAWVVYFGSFYLIFVIFSVCKYQENPFIIISIFNVFFMHIRKFLKIPKEFFSKHFDCFLIAKYEVSNF